MSHRVQLFELHGARRGNKISPKWSCTIIKVAVHTRVHVAATHPCDIDSQHFHVSAHVVILSLLHFPATRPCYMPPRATWPLVSAYLKKHTKLTFRELALYSDDNTRNVSFVNLSRWKFDPCQFVWNHIIMPQQFSYVISPLFNKAKQHSNVTHLSIAKKTLQDTFSEVYPGFTFSNASQNNGTYVFFGECFVLVQQS